MKEVIKRLEQEKRYHMDKVDDLVDAIMVLRRLTGVAAPLKPEPTEPPKPEESLLPLAGTVGHHRIRSSLKTGSLREEVLDVIEKYGPVNPNDIADELHTKFPEEYEGRRIQSIRGSVSGTLTYLRAQKPKVRNLKWERIGRAYQYWFEGKRK